MSWIDEDKVEKQVEIISNIIKDHMRRQEELYKRDPEEAKRQALENLKRIGYDSWYKH